MTHRKNPPTTLELLLSNDLFIDNEKLQVHHVMSLFTCVHVTDVVFLILVKCINIISIFLVSGNHKFRHVLLGITKAGRP
jgi:hypothetical protein